MQKYRKEFPVTENLIYLNHAGISPIPNCSKQAMQNFITATNNWGAFKKDSRIEIISKARKLGAQILGCSKSEVAFVKSTTHGIIICARGIPFKNGDNVIIPENEFPANVVPWLALNKKGVSVRFVKQKQYKFEIDDFVELIDKNTKAIAVSYVEFSTGFRNNVKKLAQICHEKNIFLVVDGIQATGIIPFNVKELGIDFMSMDSHKWLLGPEGSGYFYASENAINKIENVFEGWLSMENFMDFLNYDQPRKKSASKFEEGSPNFIGISGMAASTELLLEAGVKNVYNHIQDLLETFSDKILKKGYRIISPRDNPDHRSGILCFNKPDGDMEEIYKKLSKNKVMAALREGAIRISPHFYNTHDELEQVYKLLP